MGAFPEILGYFAEEKEPEDSQGLAASFLAPRESSGFQ